MQRIGVPEVLVVLGVLAMVLPVLGFGVGIWLLVRHLKNRKIPANTLCPRCRLPVPDVSTHCSACGQKIRG